MWAEDATVFLSQALDRSFPEALGTTYAGYLHIVPRLIVEPAVAAAALAPPPRVVAINSAVVVSLLAAYVWVAARVGVRDAARAGAARGAVRVRAADADRDRRATAANYHWYGMLASFFAFLHRPASRREAAAATAVVGFTALSDPMLALLLPLLVLRPGGLLRSAARRARHPRRGAVRARRPGAGGADLLRPRERFSLLAARPADDLRPARRRPRGAGRLVVRAAVALGRLGRGVGRARDRGRARRARRPGAAARRSAATRCSPPPARWCCSRCRWRSAARPRWRPTWATCSTGGARYTYSPLVLAWVPALLLVDRRGVWAARLATLVVVIVVASTTGTTDRSLGPDWADSLAQARQTCVAGSVVDIRVAPLSYPWEAALSCDRIRG